MQVLDRIPVVRLGGEPNVFFLLWHFVDNAICEAIALREA